MATIRKWNGKWKVEIRKSGHPVKIDFNLAKRIQKIYN